MHALQRNLLYVIRALGGFRIAQYLTRRSLRILCYHGFSLSDEHEVMPHMFMRASTFERRMQILKKRHIPVISLDEAVSRLKCGDIKRGETVITLDDGWVSNLTVGAPILERFKFPACIYVTTEHLAAGTEVFNVALHYMIRRSPLSTFRLDGLHPDLDGTYDLRGNPVDLTVRLITCAQRAFPALADRQRLLSSIAVALGMDLSQVLCDQRFSLLDRHQIRHLFSRGFDIQLHTHTHNLPAQNFEAMAPEIDNNRMALRAIFTGERRHFCFPSGQYTSQQPEWLRRLGIASATTCDPGLNPPGSPEMLLRRYLDIDHVSDIAFEAEVAGVRELARNLRSAIKIRAAPHRKPVANEGL